MIECDFLTEEDKLDLVYRHNYDDESDTQSSECVLCQALHREDYDTHEWSECRLLTYVDRSDPLFGHESDSDTDDNFSHGHHDDLCTVSDSQLLNCSDNTTFTERKY